MADTKGKKTASANQKSKKKKKSKVLVMAKWGPMKWKLSNKKANAIENDLSISYSLNDKNKREKIPVSFSYKPQLSAGVTVRTEVTRWQSLIGKSYPLYIGRKRLGPRYIKLKSASSSSIEVYGKGVMISASISLSFEEKKTKAKASSKKKKNTSLDKSKKTKTKKSKSK